MRGVPSVPAALREKFFEEFVPRPELLELNDVFRHTIEANVARATSESMFPTAVLFGAAGVGKSRLISEAEYSPANFTAMLSDHPNLHSMPLCLTVRLGTVQPPSRQLMENYIAHWLLSLYCTHSIGPTVSAGVTLRAVSSYIAADLSKRWRIPAGRSIVVAVVFDDFQQLPPATASELALTL